MAKMKKAPHQNYPELNPFLKGKLDMSESTHHNRTSAPAAPEEPQPVRMEEESIEQYS